MAHAGEKKNRRLGDVALACTFQGLYTYIVCFRDLSGFGLACYYSWDRKEGTNLWSVADDSRARWMGI